MAPRDDINNKMLEDILSGVQRTESTTKDLEKFKIEMLLRMDQVGSSVDKLTIVVKDGNGRPSLLSRMQTMEEVCTYCRKNLGEKIEEHDVMITSIKKREGATDWKTIVALVTATVAGIGAGLVAIFGGA